MAALAIRSIASYEIATTDAAAIVSALKGPPATVEQCMLAYVTKVLERYGARTFRVSPASRGRPGFEVAIYTPKDPATGRSLVTYMYVPDTQKQRTAVLDGYDPKNLTPSLSAAIYDTHYTEASARINKLLCEVDLFDGNSKDRELRAERQEEERIRRSMMYGQGTRY